MWRHCNSYFTVTQLLSHILVMIHSSAVLPSLHSAPLCTLYFAPLSRKSSEACGWQDHSLASGSTMSRGGKGIGLSKFLGKRVRNSKNKLQTYFLTRNSNSNRNNKSNRNSNRLLLQISVNAPFLNLLNEWIHATQESANLNDQAAGLLDTISLWGRFNPTTLIDHWKSAVGKNAQYFCIHACIYYTFHFSIICAQTLHSSLCIPFV